MLLRVFDGGIDQRMSGRFHDEVLMIGKLNPITLPFHSLLPAYLPAYLLISAALIVVGFSLPLGLTLFLRQIVCALVRRWLQQHTCSSFVCQQTLHLVLLIPFCDSKTTTHVPYPPPGSSVHSLRFYPSRTHIQPISRPTKHR